MDKVFISHPFSDNPQLRKRQNDYICDKLKKEGIIPISPLKLFSMYEEEDEEIREEILDYCYYLIDGCDKVYIYWYNTNFGVENCLSEGQKEEFYYCADKEIPVIFKRPPKKCSDME